MSDSLKLEDIAALLETLSKHEVSEFKLERGEERLWLKRGKVIQVQEPSHPALYASAQPNIIWNAPAPTPQSSEGQGIAPAAAAPVANMPTSSASVSQSSNLAEIRSPIVGTFYRRPAVDAEPYVKVGDTVKKGDVLCIVEAMKLMNEIESEMSGRIAEVCLEDGQMAEYGEVLFRIEPSV